MWMDGWMDGDTGAQMYRLMDRWMDKERTSVCMTLVEFGKIN